MQITVTVNQKSPVSRPSLHCEECAKNRKFSGHIKHVNINTQADWEEVTEIFREDLCAHLEAVVDLPFDETMVLALTAKPDP